MQASGHEDRSREAELISRVVVADDHAAFEKLMQMHQSSVRQVLRRLTRCDPERADDLAQETFFRAYRYISGYRGEGRFLSWLFRIAYQQFVSEERGHKKNTVALSDDLQVNTDTEKTIVAARTVEQMMGLLRADERAAVLLHYRHELTHPEISETMGLPLGTIKSLIRRSREKLKRFYESKTDARQPWNKDIPKTNSA